MFYLGYRNFVLGDEYNKFNVVFRICGKIDFKILA